MHHSSTVRWRCSEMVTVWVFVDAMAITVAIRVRWIACSPLLREPHPSTTTPVLLRSGMRRSLVRRGNSESGTLPERALPVRVSMSELTVCLSDGRVVDGEAAVCLGQA